MTNGLGSPCHNIPLPKTPNWRQGFPFFAVSPPHLPAYFAMSSSLQEATVTVNGVTHTWGLSISPIRLFVSEVCTVLVSVSGCWYLRQQTWPLLTPYCLTLDRKNTHNIPFKTILHMQDSELQGLFLLKYLWTAGYFGHVEHGNKCWAHPCSFTYLNPTTMPHKNL